MFGDFAQCNVVTGTGEVVCKCDTEENRACTLKNNVRFHFKEENVLSNQTTKKKTLRRFDWMNGGYSTSFVSKGVG